MQWKWTQQRSVGSLGHQAMLNHCDRKYTYYTLMVKHTTNAENARVKTSRQDSPIFYVTKEYKGECWSRKDVTPIEGKHNKLWQAENKTSRRITNETDKKLKTHIPSLTLPSRSIAWYLARHLTAREHGQVIHVCISPAKSPAKLLSSHDLHGHLEKRATAVHQAYPSPLISLRPSNSVATVQLLWFIGQIIHSYCPGFCLELSSSPLGETGLQKHVQEVDSSVIDVWSHFEHCLQALSVYLRVTSRPFQLLQQCKPHVKTKQFEPCSIKHRLFDSPVFQPISVFCLVTCCVCALHHSLVLCTI